MMVRPNHVLTAAAVLLAALPCTSRADVTLPAVFGDHMVLQRSMKAPFWGTAQPGEKVTVTVGSISVSTNADAAGAWQVKVGPLSAGGPLEVSVSAPSGSKTFKDVLVGDVWVCSGQSNMQMSVGSVYNAGTEIANSANVKIRLFTVPNVVSETPAKDVVGQWSRCGPDTVGGFSAVGYFFGRELNMKLGVPIGLINTSWGGTPAESWTSLKWLQDDPILSPMLTRIPKPGVDIEAAKREYEKKLKEWQDKQYFHDPGNKGVGLGYAKPEFDDSGWQKMPLPGAWETNTPALKVDGAIWFRRTVTVPDEWAGKGLTLTLGAIDDFDVTYFNGEQVGTTGEGTANWYAAPRKYTVPGALVKAGDNVIAVRAFDWFGAGGFTGPAEAMRLTGPSSDPIDLTGPWAFKVEGSRDEGNVPPQPQEPAGVWNSWTPTGLYNAMIAPLIPYGIKGAIWYQGESNAGRAFQYRTLFPAMIKCWREAWGEGDFPFFWVQLANYMDRVPQPADSEWAELRESQSMTLSLPKTGQAVIIDIGDAKDIHPKNKQDVGLRLAMAARHVAYGDKAVAPSGPLYRALKVEGDKAVLTFAFTNGGLVAKGGKLEGFAVAGEDRKFVWADATINGATVVVSSPRVPNPVAVRYGWANNPAANLYNGVGLPASPFRTDKWPGVTDKNR